MRKLFGYISIVIFAVTVFTACDSDEKQDDVSVTTMEVSRILSESAVSGGEVVSEAGKLIKSRGVCWNTTGAPTIADNRTEDGYGKGSFTSDITGLQPNTAYYARAYATAVSGDSDVTFYGQELSFTTLGRGEGELPSVMTNDVENVKDVSAVCGGVISDEGSFPVTVLGVCWSTSEDPTIDSERTIDEVDAGGSGSFTSAVTGLETETVYYIRAYAISDAGVAYGEQRSFSTQAARHDEGISNINSDVALPGPGNSGGFYYYGKGFLTDTDTDYWSLMLSWVGAGQAEDQSVLLEFSAPAGDGTRIPDGTYTVALHKDMGTENTAEPGNVYNDNDWGCWYYAYNKEGTRTTRVSAVGGEGRVAITLNSGSGNSANYTVDFEFSDTNGYIVSGKYTGTVVNLDQGTGRTAGSNYGGYRFLKNTRKYDEGL